MDPIRVFIIDDSSAMRMMIKRVLEEEREIEVVGSAATGRTALARMETAQPDVVTLDVEMPGMNGIEVLGIIRKRFPEVQVIMFSALTARSASTTLDALASGASDYVTKPSASRREVAIQAVRDQLVVKIRALSGRLPTRIRRNSISRGPPVPPLPRRPPQRQSRVDVLAVGVSTGGPNALAQLFSTIPHNFPVPVLIVQHMPPVFTRLLAERLSANCPLEFVEAQDGDRIEAGGAWLAPGDRHMKVVRDRYGYRVVLDDGPLENSCRPAVDVLFRSVAEVYGSNALAVVLTGMGQDGLEGGRRIHARGGSILAQDKDSCVVYGMPRFVIEARIADAVVPLSKMAAEIMSRARRPTRGPSSEIANAC